jgi:hypothetical protein
VSTDPTVLAPALFGLGLLLGRLLALGLRRLERRRTFYVPEWRRTC